MFIIMNIRQKKSSVTSDWPRDYELNNEKKKKKVKGIKITNNVFFDSSFSENDLG